MERILTSAEFKNNVVPYNRYNDSHKSKINIAKYTLYIEMDANTLKYLVT